MQAERSSSSTYSLPHLPLDIQLIQDFVQPSIVRETPTPTTGHDSPDDGIESSNDGNESEDEIEADLKAPIDDLIVENAPSAVDVPSDSDSSSESDFEPGGPFKPDADGEESDLDLDEEDHPKASSSGGYLHTKNEILEEDVPEVPSNEFVRDDEVLENMGEVMNVMDKTVIVRGLMGFQSSQSAGSSTQTRALEKALDAGTLLCLEDRSILGYIYETFGPTSQPLYQIKFQSAQTIDRERVTIGKQVFHIPSRSHFVFLSQIKALRGSDASNVHDEEPGEDELEFSDDEAEAQHKQYKKQKRKDRQQSVAGSSMREHSATPAQMRDQDMITEALNHNAYSAHGPYDLDLHVTTNPHGNRPPPIPYDDDPYTDAYNESRPANTFAPKNQGSGGHSGKQKGNRMSGRGKATRRSPPQSGRQPGVWPGNNNRHSNERPYGQAHPPPGPMNYQIPLTAGMQMPSRTPVQPQHAYREMSPVSQAILRATNQHMHMLPPSWGQYSPQFPHGPPMGVGPPGPFGPPDLGFAVQPHINPRFASSFGINAGMNPTFHLNHPSQHMSLPFMEPPSLAQPFQPPTTIQHMDLPPRPGSGGGEDSQMGGNDHGQANF